MKKFEKARLDVVELNSQDVISTSGTCGKARNCMEEGMIVAYQISCIEEFACLAELGCDAGKFNK